MLFRSGHGVPALTGKAPVAHKDKLWDRRISSLVLRDVGNEGSFANFTQSWSRTVERNMVLKCIPCSFTFLETVFVFRLKNSTADAFLRFRKSESIAGLNLTQLGLLKVVTRKHASEMRAKKRVSTIVG